MRLIGADGENVGVVPTHQALGMAQAADLDLVEVAPNSDPPVCRIMDFGKFLYEKNKKEKEARKAQTKIEIKEIRLRPKTNEAHRGFKVESSRRWLLAGMKVRATIRFRGREITYPEIALEDLREIAEELSDVSVIEQAPSFEGRTMFMMLAPSAKPQKKPVSKEPSRDSKKETPKKPKAVKEPEAKTEKKPEAKTEKETEAKVEKKPAVKVEKETEAKAEKKPAARTAKEKEPVTAEE